MAWYDRRYNEDPSSNRTFMELKYLINERLFEFQICSNRTFMELK